MRNWLGIARPRKDGIRGVDWSTGQDPPGADNEVGATQRYKDLVGRYSSLPLVSSPSLDLDQHVTGKALDGLFHVLGEEEKKIRHDPAARVTKLLKEVFSRSGR